MSRVTITVHTEDGGDVEVEERSSRRTLGQRDADTVAELLERAAAKVRAAYGIEISGERG